jgi:hypothetical protein
MNATFSPCGTYRYLLSEPGRAQCAWVMLNPSIAGREGADGKPITDPTNTRVREFSRMWGYDGYVIVNNYAAVATEPRDLWLMDDPVGPANDSYLVAVASLPLVVVACGGKVRRDRLARTVELLRLGGARQLWCLGTNDDGTPKHPLYLPYSAKLQEWQPERITVPGV